MRAIFCDLFLHIKIYICKFYFMATRNVNIYNIFVRGCIAGDNHFHGIVNDSKPYFYTSIYSNLRSRGINIIYIKNTPPQKKKKTVPKKRYICISHNFSPRRPYPHSVSCLLITWCCKEPRHQLPWYGASLSKNVNSLRTLGFIGCLNFKCIPVGELQWFDMYPFSYSTYRNPSAVHK